MSNWYKKANDDMIDEYVEPHFNNDFRDVDIRRLHGLLMDFKRNSEKALEKMEELLNDGQYDISFENVKKDLSYELSQLGLRD